MFSGIIENLGKVEQLTQQGSNKSIYIKSSFTNELKIDQSIAHNGVCLTVEDIKGDIYKVTAVEETLKKSNLGMLRVDDEINLERSMTLQSGLDGHIVQGHVDCTATCTSVVESEGSWLFNFSIDPKFRNLIVEKGSICINGISLNIFNCEDKSFTVTIIPYTYNHTNIKNIVKDSIVNIEFDILGKYVARYLDSINLNQGRH